MVQPIRARDAPFKIRSGRRRVDGVATGSAHSAGTLTGIALRPRLYPLSVPFYKLVSSIEAIV
ncbi:hypothetical protein GCM10008024_29460 [Allgaiera indica]|uniref:Uncharacterized protein n=1 Tax=Allgaiera indica TaxID=765699 RepID=A0AAN4UTG7_9RHOB|nr:hypothetical protein GCM10008024_29460 [Allgaiera indica]